MQASFAVWIPISPSHSHTAQASGYPDARRHVATLNVSWLFAGVLVLVAVLVAAVSPLLWRPEAISVLMRENGPVENATIVFYFVAVASLWLVDRGALDGKSAAAASVILIACVAKEISLRRQLLAATGFKPEPFIASAWPNLLAAVLAVALLVSVAWLLWCYARAASNVSPRESDSTSVTIGGVSSRRQTDCSVR